MEKESEQSSESSLPKIPKELESHTRELQEILHDYPKRAITDSDLERLSNISLR